MLALGCCPGAAAAQTPPGLMPALAATQGASYQAAGMISVNGPGGTESGTVAVAAWGEGYCKVTVTLGPPILRRVYSAVMNGQQVAITAPSGLGDAIALPINPAVGCALLPGNIAYDKLAAAGGAAGTPALALDTSGRPATLAWEHHGHAASLNYSGYSISGAALLAGDLEITLDGKPAVSIKLNSITPAAYTAADFPVPPLPAVHGRANAGGGK